MFIIIIVFAYNLNHVTSKLIFSEKFFTENWKFTGYIFTKSVPPTRWVVIRTEHSIYIQN